MSPPDQFSPSEIESQLIAKGVPREKARSLALTVTGGRAGPPREAMVPVAFPLHIVLPWTALVSDNRKYSPAAPNGSRGGKLLLRPEYREAKAKARNVARDAVGDGLPVAFPLRLVARVYVPNARPGHDVANFAKCCHDALETVVYTNDEWLHRIVWERAGVDPDHPRCEIEITKF